MYGARGPPGILDRPIGKGKGEINLSTFAFLFSEIVQYSHKRVDSIPALQEKLSDIGRRVGDRMLELLVMRERSSKRETKLNQFLLFIQMVVWKALFGKQADLLEKSSDADNEYLISDRDLLVNRFISVPPELKSLNCGSFVAGIVEAILNGAHFPARVTAHSVEEKGTTLLIKFNLDALPPDAL
mmetsp:Transcript_34088/g.89506  ORF Transcript_34088/g.89506 Transcript_34088/m.89506 type:complete len:185 (+) Transcript_34088:297-851(+)